MSAAQGWNGYLWGAAIAVLVGCSTPHGIDSPPDTAHYQNLATQIEYPVGPTPCDDSLLQTPPPRTICDRSPAQYRNMSLQEVIQLSLTNSHVLLDLGGTILHTPDNAETTYSIAVQETDPEYGPEAALSDFDAQFSSSLYSEKNKQQYNNTALGNNGFFAQNYDESDTQITKRGVTGAQYTIRNVIDFDRNTNVANTYQNGAFDAYVEGEVRQPLLQGAGVEYNRIAGPGAKPGVYNGVLVARIRTDISASDFEIGLRDFVSNVENAYWDLYFAYRDLDIKLHARDEALETWRRVHALFMAGGARKGGEADKEAQAREQYFRFKQDVEDSLAGHPVDGTRTNNGSQPGTFRATPGVLIAERRLRLLMGVPSSDGTLIRPADEPSTSPVAFDWSSLTSEALFRREELRRQRWVIQSRQLEMTAAQNFLQPNLDLVGRYDLRGFGHTLDDSYGAVGNLFATNHQEWQVGAEFSVPLGFRQGHAAVRNAELRVTQARAILREQERIVISELSNALAEKDRAYTALQTGIDRSKAAQDQLDALKASYQAKQEGFFEVLDAQRQLADALSRYYQSRVEYALAIRNIHYEKGSLLEYCDVHLSEGGWPDKAYRDAARRDRHRGAEKSIDYTFRRPPVVSAGTPAQAGSARPSDSTSPEPPVQPQAPTDGAPLVPPPPPAPTAATTTEAMPSGTPNTCTESATAPRTGAPTAPEILPVRDLLDLGSNASDSPTRLFTPISERMQNETLGPSPREYATPVSFTEPAK